MGPASKESGVADQDVEAPEGRAPPGSTEAAASAALRASASTATTRCGSLHGGGDPGRDLAQGLSVDVGEDDVSPLAGEALGDGAADAAGRARDQRDLP